jgi:hypothetical protein
VNGAAVWPREPRSSTSNAFRTVSNTTAVNPADAARHAAILSFRRIKGARKVKPPNSEQE